MSKSTYAKQSATLFFGLILLLITFQPAGANNHGKIEEIGQVGHSDGGNNLNFQSNSKFQISGNLIFSVEDSFLEFSTVRIVDISDPRQPVWIGQYSPSRPTHDNSQIRIAALKAVDQTLFIGLNKAGGQSLGVEVLDISTPSAPVSIAFFEDVNAAGVGNLQIQGNRAYFLTSHGLSVLDITNLQSPSYLGSFNHDYLFSYDLTQVRGNQVYFLSTLSDGVQQLAIYDFTNPSQPSLLGTYSPQSPASAQIPAVIRSFKIVDGIVYTVTSNHVLEVLDVKNPSDIKLLSSFDFSESQHNFGHVEFYLSKNIAYLFDVNIKRVVILDLSNPDSTTLLTEFWYTHLDKFSWIGVSFFHEIAYLSIQDDTLALLDLRDPLNPVINTTFKRNNISEVLLVENELIFARTSPGRLLFLRHTEMTQSANETYCPSSGVWPEGCIPAPTENQPPPSTTQSGEPCPESGVWPQGCVPNSQPPATDPQPCPQSGVWPRGCIFAPK